MSEAEVARMSPGSLHRRSLLKLGVFAAGSVALGPELRAQDKESAKKPGKPTQFQIACMTLPYSQYPLERALAGIKNAGCQFVAWGTTHKEEGEEKPVPVMPADAPPAKAKELGQRCRDIGLTPLMMFSTVYPEHPNAIEVFKGRIQQAE